MTRSSRPHPRRPGRPEDAARAEALDHTVQQLEKGEITAIEAIDGLLSEEARRARRAGSTWPCARPSCCR